MVGSECKKIRLCDILQNYGYDTKALSTIKNGLTVYDKAVLVSEEASEITQVCMKILRCSPDMRTTNPTPRTEADILASLYEELGDLIISLSTLNISIDIERLNKRLARWRSRTIDARVPNIDDDI